MAWAEVLGRVFKVKNSTVPARRRETQLSECISGNGSKVGRPSGPALEHLTSSIFLSDWAQNSNIYFVRFLSCLLILLLNNIYNKVNITRKSEW